MKIASWNVNSLRVRLPQVAQWVGAQQPDIVCLQETKLTDENFPHAEIEALGFHTAYSGQKTYNGVAILSKSKPQDVVTEFPAFDDPQKRVLCVTVGDVRVLNIYVPNGQAVGSDKFEYKLRWLDAMIAFAKSQLALFPNMLIVGDFNIAPRDQDVHDPELWRGQVLCSDAERSKFVELLGYGFHDTFQKFDQDAEVFSWWDYRAAGYARNRGLRIDHILASADLYKQCSHSSIDTEPRGWERPSDHAPAVAEFLI